MRKQKILEKNIEELELNTDVTNELKNNAVNTIQDLWELKRKDLKNYGIKDSDISQITIKLQLYGLDLNKKIY